MSSTPWDQVQAEFSCPHPDSLLTYKVASNGVRQFKRQCRRCGTPTSGAVKYSELTLADRADAVPFDEELRKSWWERRSERHAQIREENREAEDASWWTAYRKHLSSPRWAVTRAKILKRARGICEGCGDRHPTEVHHLTYERLGREMLFDLVALCDPCHKVIHKKLPCPPSWEDSA